MRVKITKAFGQFSAGQIVPEMPPNQARTLIGRNLAVEVKVETVADPLVVPNDRAVRLQSANRNVQKPTLKVR